MKLNKRRVRTWQFIVLAALVAFIFINRHNHQNYRRLVQYTPKEDVRAMQQEEHVVNGIVIVYSLFLCYSLFRDFRGRKAIKPVPNGNPN
jgi:hypothetical protein